MSRLQEFYRETVVKNLMATGAYKNVMDVPRMEKIVVNVGMGEMAHQKELVDSVRDEMATLLGQRPALRLSKKSISNFKIRDGVPVGYKTTLRKKRMYEFMDRLINFVIPRIRDFRGIPKTGFDQR